MKQKSLKKAVSLFSSAGIGELGLEANGIKIVAANELVKSRCELYCENFPDTKMFEGSIWSVKEEIIKHTLSLLKGEDLFLLYATPPCQGMSTNGAGKLKAEIAAGNRPAVDERNLLIIPALEIATALRPMWVLFENVPGMKDTVIPVAGKARSILELIQSQLGKEYLGAAKVISCSDYGIPQQRKRLITIYTRDPNGQRFLRESNLSLLTDSDVLPASSLWDAIGDLPPLDATPGRNENLEFHPLHFVNTMNEEKYWWVENTKEGDTAFNNQCVNEKCRFQLNPGHKDVKVDGRSVSSSEIPIFCQMCGELLPRPNMKNPKTGQRRLIKGFHSSYRRMRRNEPSRALTRNFPFEASDNKIHPTQNRVLSFYEALVIQTIAEYSFSWEKDGKRVNKKTIADCIGESVPPKLIDLIVRKMIAISDGRELNPRGQADMFGKP